MHHSTYYIRTAEPGQPEQHLLGPGCRQWAIAQLKVLRGEMVRHDELTEDELASLAGTDRRRVAA